MNKILQPYKDWLMLTRDKIEPKVGDNIQETYDSGMKDKTVDDNFIKDYYNTGECYLDDCYVEVPYPVIEWREKKHINPNYMNAIIATHTAYVGKLPLDINIEEDDNDNDSVLNYDDIIFEGTVSECKQQANKLLYGTTE